MANSKSPNISNNAPQPNPWGQLRDSMQRAFDLADIKTVCFDLEIDYENLGEGLGKQERITKLLETVRQNGRIADLLTILNRHRPHLDWPNAALFQPNPTPPTRTPATPRTPSPPISVKGLNQNPFTAGSMITNPHQFIGRRAEQQQIINRLNGTQPQGTSVVGPRRIGKSSLLHYLVYPHPDEPLRPHTHNRLIYLDAQAAQCQDPDHFRLTLSLTLLAANNTPDNILENSPLHQLQQQITREHTCNWSQANQILELLPFHPIICLDEFEALLTSHFDDRFFNALRSWANNGLLTWITASAEPLQNYAQLHGYTSQFFNILTTQTLAGFTTNDTNALLQQANNTPHPFTQKELRWLHELGADHPYHLQIAAAHLWQQKADGHKIGRRQLHTHLCQQSTPPPHCQPTIQNHTIKHIAQFLPWLLVMLLTCLLWFTWAAFRNFATTKWQYLTIKDGLEEFMISSIIILILLKIIHNKQKAHEFLRNLWKQLR